MELMAKRAPKIRGDDDRGPTVQVRASKELARLLNIVSAHHDMTVAEYLDKHLLDFVRKDLATLARKIVEAE